MNKLTCIFRINPDCETVSLAFSAEKTSWNFVVMHLRNRVNKENIIKPHPGIL